MSQTIVTIVTVERCPACSAPLQSRTRNDRGGFRCEFDCGAVSDSMVSEARAGTVFHGCPVSMDGAKEF